MSNAFASRQPALSPHQETSSSPAAAPAANKQRQLFPAWSAADNVKDSVSREFNKASDTVQSKTGHIELHSGKYYAACITGGMLACVST